MSQVKIKRLKHEVKKAEENYEIIFSKMLLEMPQRAIDRGYAFSKQAALKEKKLLENLAHADPKVIEANQALQDAREALIVYEEEQEELDHFPPKEVSEDALKDIIYEVDGEQSSAYETLKKIKDGVNEIDATIQRMNARLKALSVTDEYRVEYLRDTYWVNSILHGTNLTNYMDILRDLLAAIPYVEREARHDIEMVIKNCENLRFDCKDMKDFARIYVSGWK